MEELARRAKEQREAAEEWLCPVCAFSNVGTDGYCMNKTKSGA